MTEAERACILDSLSIIRAMCMQTPEPARSRIAKEVDRLKQLAEDTEEVKRG